jgi:hypothetical protein
MFPRAGPFPFPLEQQGGQSNDRRFVCQSSSISFLGLYMFQPPLYVISDDVVDAINVLV